MNAIEVKNLTKKFKNFKLDNIDLTLPSGCIMGLIGENGAGKSTTIKLILDMLRRDNSEVKLLGRDAVREGRAVREEIGVVLDEVGIPGCLDSRKVGKIMAGTFKNWDDGAYSGLIGRFGIPKNKKFSDLSRGTKMKLGLAVALSHHPKLLILDEATSGLDPVVRDELIEMLMDFTRSEDHSILISSHIVSDLEKLCDYVAFLHRGRLMLSEEKDELLSRYWFLRCPVEDLKAVDPGAILHKKISGYGAEAIVRRDSVPRGADVSPVSIEDLFIYMVKEAG